MESAESTVPVFKDEPHPPRHLGPWLSPADTPTQQHQENFPREKNQIPREKKTKLLGEKSKFPGGKMKFLGKKNKTESNFSGGGGGSLSSGKKINFLREKNQTPGEKVKIL